MRWVLLWLVLVLAAAGVLGLVGRNLWRKAKALTAELGQAGERLSAVTASLADLQEQAAGRDIGADQGWGHPDPPTLRRQPRRRG
jgi:Flp pilus assembly protein CpaB